MSRWLVLFAFTLGCKGTGVVADTSGREGDADTDADSDSDADVDSCTATISALFPIDGAVDVALSPDVVASFSAHVDDGQFTVGIDGATGFTVLADDGLSATFTPDANLTAATTYQASASACGGALTTSSFTTLSDVVDGNDLTGNTYGTVFGDLAFTEPPQATMAAAQGLGFDLDFMVLIGVQTYDAANDELTAAAATGGKQGGNVRPDCEGAIGNIAADFSANPAVAVGPEDLAVPIDGGAMTFEDFTMTGTFALDGSALETAHLTGALDLRGSGVPCALLATLGGATCVACNDGVSECLLVDASAASAPLVPGLDLVTACHL
jgi:hypothetical protein